LHETVDLFMAKYVLMIKLVLVESSLPTSTLYAPKQVFWIAYAATTTLYRQHRFYHTSTYRFMQI